MTLVIAHRGASAYEVENSLAAFRRAVTQGADAVELDIHGTSDGEFVVHHDEVLRGARLATLSLEQVRSSPLSNGERIPTLAEALQVLGTLIVFVEVKALPPALDSRLFHTLEAGPQPARYHIHSFDHRIIRRLHDRKPGVVFGALSSSYPCRPLQALADAGATELWQHESMIDRDLVVAAHREGYPVYAWTVDDPVRISELSNFGVDGICTNRPDVARRTLS